MRGGGHATRLGWFLGVGVAIRLIAEPVLGAEAHSVVPNVPHASAAATVLDDEPEDERSFPATDEQSAVRLRAQLLVENALRYLADQLRARGDGSFSRVSGGQDPTVAKVALAVLAFQAAGYDADHSRYAPELRIALRWLLRNGQSKVETEADGTRVETFYFYEPNDTISRMHGHGFATWAVAMAYGMTLGASNQADRTELRQRLVAAIRLIERAQTESGGWGYEPVRGTFHEGSVTVTALQALRAARDAGIHVDGTVIDRALDYLRRSQMEGGPNDGSFRYRLGDPKTSFALTAAALSSLNLTGVYDGAAIERGLEYMRREDPVTSYQASEPFPWYGRLYAAQAYWQYRELRHFRRFYPELVQRLAAEVRDEDGSFSSGEYGDAYATAMAALCLSVPFGYLPSFQR